MQKLVWQNANGVELDLTSGNYGITEWEGFSNTSLNIQQQQVPFQDGGVFLDALIEQRELTITLAMQDNNNLELRYQQRRELISALNPKLGEGYLIYTNDFISKRIKCVPQIPLFETHNSDTAGTPKASLSWTACSPYWEDLEETTVELPTSTPIENNGDVPCQIKAVLNAGASNPVLFNKANNKEIGLSGVFDFDVEVNTNYGEKSIKTVELGMKWISGGNFYSCCFGQGKLIFVGTVSVCIELFTGKKYTLNITGRNINKIKYINNTFFALSLTYIYRSIDGINWTRSVGAQSQEIYDIVYAKNQYVIVASGGLIKTSLDGVNWTTQTSGVSTYLNGIVFANNMFVVVGNTGTVLTSPDGVNWTSRTSGTNYSLSDITFANNMFVAVGNSKTIITSADGISWTTQTAPSSISNFNEVGEAKGEIFALANGGRFATSVDGTNWTSNTVGKGVNLSDMMFIYNKYYICGENGSIFTSEDKTTWTQMQTVYDDELSDTVYAEGVFIACGITGLYTSEDGENWVKRITGTRIVSATYGNGKYIAVSNGGKVYSSTDGVNWDYITLSNTQDYNRIRFVNNIFIIAGNYGTIITSPDGENWTERTSGTTQALKGIAYGNGIYVVAGRECSVVSEDLANWVSYTEPVSFRSNALAFGNGVFISADGTFGSRWASTDGHTWVLQYAFGQGRSVVEYLNNTFIYLCSDTQNVEMSKDGTNWNKLNAQIAFGLFGVSYGEGKYVFVGDYGLIYHTYIASSQNNISSLTPESDMTFNLEQGENEIIYLTDGNTHATLSYRQKYIGV